ncbi:MAG: Rrf2 family transcriptional regulator [Candidatus Margulisiibacteriota bacterium]|jgi:Rrf2 family protein
MKFSVRVQYGMQAMLELALNSGSGPIQISDIAREQKIPIRYLEQILLVLKRSGLVLSTRGKNGGYTLSRRSSDINVLQIIESVEGALELTNKKMKKFAVLFDAFNKIQNNIKKDLTNLSLEELAFRKRQQDLAINYNI